MADFSVTGGSAKHEGFAADLASSRGVLVTDGTSADTKGVWTEIIASTGFEYEEIRLALRTFSASTTARHFVDIGIGGSGSEQVLVANIAFKWSGSALGVWTIILPISVAKGSRLSLRTQSDAGTQPIRITGSGCSIAESQIGGLGKATTYGADTANTNGVAVDPGTTANTKGSYAQITSSTSEDMKKMIVCVHHLHAASAASGYLMDIAIGGAGSEEIIVPDIALYTDAAIVGITPAFLHLDVDIPAGTRIAVRTQCSTTIIGRRITHLNIIGLS